MTRAPRTHCRQGHPFNEENTYISKYGTQGCVECRRQGRRQAQFKKTGKWPEPIPPYEDRFKARMIPSPGGCILWGGHLSRGYGRVTYKGRLVQAHRVSYEMFKGPIPEGLQLDHLCRVRHCVNPDHLEPVTPSENTLRGYRARAEYKQTANRESE